MMPILKANQRALVVAMDHAQTNGITPGLENPGKVIDSVIDAGADAVMTTFGVIKRYQDKLIGRVPTILRLDGGPSLYREDWLANTEWALFHSLEDAHKLGVDGVVLCLFIGIPCELETLRIVAKVASDCMASRLPLMVEALPCQSERIPDAKAANPMASAARIGFERGADLIKTYYTGSPESFREVTENCPVPCLIAGGAKMNTSMDTLEVVEGAMTAGASGVVFGRNIWQNKRPAAMVNALKVIIHHNQPASEAIKLLA